MPAFRTFDKETLTEALEIDFGHRDIGIGYKFMKDFPNAAAPEGSLVIYFCQLKEPQNIGPIQNQTKDQPFCVVSFPAHDLSSIDVVIGALNQLRNSSLKAVADCLEQQKS